MRLCASGCKRKREVWKRPLLWSGRRRQRRWSLCRRRKRLRSVSGRPEKVLVLDRSLREHSSEDEQVQVNSEEEPEENPFLFRRKEGVQYHAPELDFGNNNNNTLDMKGEGEAGSFHLTAVSASSVGFCRRRVGRGGRLVLDRISSKSVSRSVLPPVI